MKKTMKGQMTFVNVFIIFLTAIFYFVVVAPVLQPLIASAIVTMNLTPNDYTPMTVMGMSLVPFAFVLALIFTMLNWSAPKRQ